MTLKKIKQIYILIYNGVTCNASNLLAFSLLGPVEL